MKKMVVVVLAVVVVILPVFLRAADDDQVEISAQFVAFKKADISALMEADPSARIDVARLNELRKAGKSELLFSPAVVTRSRQEAVVKAVEEYTYPTEFSFQQLRIYETNILVPQVTGGFIQPASFEKRDVGVTLRCIPDVTADRNSIKLTIHPEMVGKPEWKSYTARYVDTAGNSKDAMMEKPTFHASVLDTVLTLKNGKTVIVGGGMSSRDGEKVIYLFITCRLLGTDGEPISN